MAKRPIVVGPITALASSESVSRGRTYFRNGAVGPIVRRGEHLSADVEGSDIEPYRITVRLGESGVADASCSCPYEYGGYCKHIVAVLLKASDRKANIIERPALTDLLADLDKSQLIAILGRRLEVDHTLASWLDAELATSPKPADPSAVSAPRRRTLVDPGPVRDQAKALMRGRYRKRYWDDYRSTGGEDELQQLVEKAVPFLEAGDGRNALRVLTSVAAEFVDGWLEESYGGDEHMYLMFDDIARMMAEAVLLSDLGADERDALAVLVEDWRQRLSDYGVDDSFTVTILALETAWDQPELQAVLTGKARGWPPSGRGDDVELRLTAIRLRVLDGQGRTDEHLRLSKACGAHTEHATMLVKLDRVSEAIAYAAKRFKTPEEAHELSKVLRTAGHDEDATELAKAGLALVGERPTGSSANSIGPHGLAGLAHWLRDYAGGLGKIKLALKAAAIAFEQTHSREDYRAAESWAKSSGAGKTWPKLREALLAHLKAAQYAHDRTLILLEEGMIDDAVRSAGEATDYQSDSETLMRLSDAAAASHSDWVIRFSVAKASRIMDDNRSGHYAEAARWLEKAALAYESAGRDEDWVVLLAWLIGKHKRKYKLRPLLEALR